MLNHILDIKEQEIAKLYASGYHYPRTVQERELPHYSFLGALQQPHHSSALIAEVKKASPSKGIIRKIFDPIEISLAYDAAGADCLSVLTDRTFFQGDEAYIAQIKQAVSKPVLRKDFIIEEIQIEQSVELGADAILLIAKVLSPQKLQQLYDRAQEAGLDVLIEVHDEHELEQVFKVVRPNLIGINNRNLKTFDTDLGITVRLLKNIPQDVMVISESGIHSAEMRKRLEEHGVHGFLVGEYFMRQENIRKAVNQLYANT